MIKVSAILSGLSIALVAFGVQAAENVATAHNHEADKSTAVEAKMDAKKAEMDAKKKAEMDAKKAE
jgi:hypothetical protein